MSASNYLKRGLKFAMKKKYLRKTIQRKANRHDFIVNPIFGFITTHFKTKFKYVANIIVQYNPLIVIIALNQQILILDQTHFRKEFFELNFVSLKVTLGHQS